MWLGLMQCDAWKPAYSLRNHQQTLCYCAGWSGEDGSIQGRAEDEDDDIQSDISPYGAGDWICFNIDFDAKTVEFYLGDKLQYKSNSDVFPEGECYFVGELDTVRFKKYPYIFRIILVSSNGALSKTKSSNANNGDMYSSIGPFWASINSFDNSSQYCNIRRIDQSPAGILARLPSSPDIQCPFQCLQTSSTAPH